ncbi:MAG: right-handed parallel beta-helix repeat-containing protein, partial [Planctomycetes bacterium]|nr:right-handed parallel beta-helix repeat-containing protein [Planctomycetota bacterium]
MKTGKRAILVAVVVFVIFGLVFSGDIIYADEAYGQLNEPVGSGHPGAGTNTYLFSPSSSSVVRTGGFAGVNETYAIEGQLQLTVDFDAETASFDVVDAYLPDPLGNLHASERDLGELFEMTELVADSVSESGIYFTNYEPGLFGYEIELFLFFQDISSSRGYVTLFGTHSGPCYDCYRYEINATMVKKMVFYVDADATGANDGSSWENAYNHLQDALAGALSGDEIMVAQGSYTPDSNSTVPDGSGDREATFRLIDGVTIKGGYAGGGEMDPDKRDVEAYKTILSGDLAGDDGGDFANNSENSYHVVTGSGTDTTAILNGFTITASNADGDGYPVYHNIGGGMCTQNGSPTVMKCTFIANSAYSGGGMANWGNSSTTVTNCTFIGNSADYGGGMNCGGDATVINCTFIGNSARVGGGMNCGSDVTVIGCMFIDNTAESSGGGINCGGTTITNCMFIDNTAEYNGGGMSIQSGGPTLTNCTFSGNSAGNEGGGIWLGHIWSNDVLLTNCILWGNNAEDGPQILLSGSFEENLIINYCDIQGGELDIPVNSGSLNWGEGNMGEDLVNDNPLFADADNGDYHLKSEAGRWDVNLYRSSDLIENGIVDLVDFAEFANSWFLEGHDIPADLNRDDIVNVSDLFIFAEKFLTSGDTSGWAIDSVTSPCIDAGDPRSNWAAEVWPHGRRINMGMYGGTTEASISFGGNYGDEPIAIDGFESYDNDGNSIHDVWTDKLGWGDMQILLMNDPWFSPINSMRLRYQIAYEPFYAIAARSFSPAQDWTVLGVEVLTIHCYGTADN